MTPARFPSARPSASTSAASSPGIPTRSPGTAPATARATTPTAKSFKGRPTKTLSQQTEEGEGGAVYGVRPATPDDLDWIFRLEVDAYSAAFAVARTKLGEWFCANPCGFSVLTMNGEKVGQITMLPLRPALLDGFARATIREQHIGAAGLFHPAA